MFKTTSQHLGSIGSFHFTTGFSTGGVSCSFGGESIDTRGGKLDPNRTPVYKVIHESSHPSPSTSYLVSRQHSFTPQPHSENTLLWFLVLEVHVRSSSTDSNCQSVSGVCLVSMKLVFCIFVVPVFFGCLFSQIVCLL
jgi:hypothetical protein